MDDADHARQYAQHATLGAARDGARGRGLWIEAAIARPPEVRRKEAGLAFEAKDGAVHVWLAEQHAGVVREVTGGEVVRAVHHDVVGAQDLKGVVAGEAGLVKDDLDVRIEAMEGLSGGSSLRAADIWSAVEDLALEVREVHGIKIHNPEFANTRGRECRRPPLPDKATPASRVRPLRCTGRSRREFSFGPPARLRADSNAASSGGFRRCSIP